MYLVFLLDTCLFIHFAPFLVSGHLCLFGSSYYLEAVFTSARFSLTANVSHGTLDLVLSFVDMHFTAASRGALMKFSYSSFGVRTSVFSCSALNLFLNTHTHTYTYTYIHIYIYIYIHTHKYIYVYTTKEKCPLGVSSG